MTRKVTVALKGLARYMIAYTFALCVNVYMAGIHCFAMNAVVLVLD